MGEDSDRARHALALFTPRFGARNLIVAQAANREDAMTEQNRRTVIAAGAAAAAVAAAPQVFAATGEAGAFFEKGPVRIHYVDTGSGYPLLLIAGGGLNSAISNLKNPFDSIGEFKGEYRCISADLRKWSELVMPAGFAV